MFEKKEAKEAIINVAQGCTIEAGRVKDRKVIATRSSKFTVARDEKVTVTFPGRHLLARVPCPLGGEIPSLGRRIGTNALS